MKTPQEIVRRYKSETTRDEYSLENLLTQAIKDREMRLPSEDEITQMAIKRAKEALGGCANPRLCYIRGLNYGARWLKSRVLGGVGK